MCYQRFRIYQGVFSACCEEMFLMIIIIIIKYKFMFRVITPYSMASTNVSEEHTASIFWVKVRQVEKATSYISGVGVRNWSWGTGLAN
jgi:hypothetical protein